MTHRALGVAGSGAVAALAAAVLLLGGGEAAPGETRGDAPARAAGGRTFFVDPAGSDRAAGTRTRPWRTVGRVNRAGLRPGDRVLFRGGATFDDAALMPEVSGEPGRPVVFSVFGDGTARLPRAIWFRDRHHLAFDRFTVRGPGGHGIQGSGTNISVTRSRFERVRLGVLADGSRWRIAGNVVAQTGDSGLYLEGDRYDVDRNTIEDTGIDASIDFAKHGIYLRAPNSTIRRNTIRRFESNGVSVRYRNSVVEENTFSDGPIAIAWFQYDDTGGTSRWRRNEISSTTDVGIYVSPRDRAGSTRETFLISDNRIEPARGPRLLLSPTSGSYRVSANVTGDGRAVPCTPPGSEQTSC